MVEAPSDRARARLKLEKDRSGLTEREIGEALDWSQSKVAKVLGGTIELRLDELAELCRAVRLDLVECVREPGRELVADLTPSEVRLFQRWRRLNHDQQRAIATILGFVVDEPSKKLL